MSAAVALKGEIAALRASVTPLLDRLDELRKQYREALSREWIAANGVTRDQVLVPGVDDVPLWTTLRDVGIWMAVTERKERWVVWNGRIHSVEDVLAGRTTGERPGCLEHLPPRSGGGLG